MSEEGAWKYVRKALDVLDEYVLEAENEAHAGPVSARRLLEKAIENRSLPDVT